MPIQDQYPLLYHAHHSLHSEDLPFWLDLAARYGAPILELGCGTGRVLNPLAGAGYGVYGLDMDAGMLAVVRRTIRTDRIPGVHLIRGDFAAIPLQVGFNLILMPCNTFSTLSADFRILALKQVKACLAPGGMFAASLPNPALMRYLPRRGEAQVEDLFLHPADGEPVQVSSRWERIADRVVITWDYDHLLPDGRVERQSTQVHHYLASSEELISEFDTAGLEVATSFGDYDRSEYTHRSPYLILIAQAAKF
jgi:SAM-dependent methyltransferase